MQKEHIVDQGMKLPILYDPLGYLIFQFGGQFSLLKGFRPGSKVCSENMNDWQYLSLGDLHTTK